VPERSSTRATVPPHDERATESDVYAAYRLILGREPDVAGLRHYRELVADGLPRTALAHAFLHSEEHHQQLQQEHRAGEVAVDLGGYQVMVDRSDPDFGADIAHWRIYEEPVRQALREQLTADDICLDVGANVGVMTFLAATVVGPHGRVIAVEPNPDNIQLLYRGLLLNRLDNVEVLPLAASDRRSVFALSGHSNSELQNAGPPDANHRLVQAAALDDLLGDLPRLDLVKLDIEGSEPAALRGLERLVTTYRPTLLVEFNPRCLTRRGEDPSAFAERLLELYPTVRAISHFGDDERFRRAGDLLSFWRRRADEVTAAGRLPQDLLHFDLVTERR